MQPQTVYIYIEANLLDLQDIIALNLNMLTGLTDIKLFCQVIAIDATGIMNSWALKGIDWIPSLPVLTSATSFQ